MGAECARVLTRLDHLLITELLGNIRGAGARDIDPSLGEQGASSQDEGQVEDGVEGIQQNLLQRARRRNVVSQSTNGDCLTSVGTLDLTPSTQEADEEVGGESLVQELRDEVQVGHEGRLQDDGDVAGVEQLDGVAATLTALFLVLHGDVDTEALQEDDSDEDNSRGQEIGDVGQVGSVESLTQSLGLVGLGDEQVEERNDSTLELHAASSADGGGTERLPHNRLANVGGNEQGDGTAETVTLLQQLVLQRDSVSIAIPPK